MKLLRTYNYKSKYDWAPWIEIPYVNKVMDLWRTDKLKRSSPYLEYTPENLVPIGLNPFKK